MSAVRKLAPRHAKPAQRHFAKKAPKDARDLDESSDEEEEQVQAEDAGDVQIGDYDAQEEETDLKTLVPATPARPRGAKTVKVALGNVEVKDGRVFVDGKAESGMTVVEQQKAQESSESESDEEEEESSEESSEEDEPPRPQLRPVFVSKQQRETLKERDAIAFDSEEAMKKREQAAEERKRQSVNMVGESIKRGMEEKEAKMPGQEIDDTDGLDPEAEFNLWRMRELMRLKREKEAERAREEERLEIERRRALPEEQRLKEDMERAKKLREAKPQGSGAFLQKYWHKGAFYQDLDELKNRDYTAPIESQVDISLLPKVMQVKDFGKRSRTKYTYLKDQDTTLAPPPKVGGATLPQPPGGQGCFLCGGPHLKKDCPQNVQSGGQATGSNSRPAASERRWGERSRDQSSWKDRDRSPQRRRSPSPRRDDYRGNPRTSEQHRTGSPRQRSRSPHRSSRRHSRSRSPYRSQSRSAKRRRVDD